MESIKNINDLIKTISFEGLQPIPKKIELLKFLKAIEEAYILAENECESLPNIESVLIKIQKRQTSIDEMKEAVNDLKNKYCDLDEKERMLQELETQHSNLNDLIHNNDKRETELQLNIEKNHKINEDLENKINASNNLLNTLTDKYESLIQAHKVHLENNNAILNVIGKPENLDATVKEIETKLIAFDSVLKNLIKERQKTPLNERVIKS